MQGQLIKFFGGAHAFVYRITGGRIGHRIPGGPRMLLLSTIGCRSGKQRTTPVQYAQDNGNYVLIASFGGSPTHPAWWLNLRAEGEGVIQVGGRKLQVLAREAEGEERERLWAMMTEMYAGYAGYAARTKRRIPVVVLEPA